MNDNAKKINLLIQNAENIEADTGKRKTALLNLKVNHSHLEILKSFDADGLYFYTEILESSSKKRVELSNLKINDDILLDISPSFLQTNFNFNFYFTFDEFIEKNNIFLKDEYYYILDKKITSFQTNENKYLTTHSIVLKLQDILSDISDFTETKLKNKIYTIFDTKKIEINSTFKFNDIEFILENDPNFGEVICNLYDELELKSEKKIRALFFKKSLEGIFEKKKISMSDILRNIERIFSEYESHYRAYINSLEPEKIKAQFEEEHNNFLKELNVILGDVHNKIIFIPIAFIFGASQLTSGTDIKGLIIIVGMLIFTIFVSLFLETHNKVLNIINGKIIERENYYKEKEPTLYKSYNEKIDMLKNLYSSIKTRITIIRYSNWILTLAAVLVFKYLHN